MDGTFHEQMLLHSDRFDLCRICLFEPESNRDIQFENIFSPKNKEIKLQEQMKEFLNIQIPVDDICPKIVCEKCLHSLRAISDLKKLAAESQIVLKYIAKKKFGSTVDEPSHSTFNESNFLSNSTKTNDLTNKTHSFSQNKSKISTNSSNINNQDTSSHSFATNQSNFSDSEFDDDDDDNDDDDDDISCQELSFNQDVIYISDSEESISDKQGSSNNHGNKSRHYCTICKKKEYSYHKCSTNNSEFSTCLVPNCNILCRSMIDFESHYRQHIGMSSRANMCRFCFKEMKHSDRDLNGFHTNCHMDNIFKCYTCNIIFKNISEFACHKQKTHNGLLLDAAGNYLCFHCEKSSSDLLNINEHITLCRENKIKHEDELAHEKSSAANVNEKIILKRNIQGEKIPPSSNNVLFTCLKPNCNLIFQSFSVFKHHYREHFEIGHQFMCWQCCMPFLNINILRTHQVKGNCRTPGMFKCLYCTEKFNDIQCLSIHKFTKHNGVLICKNKKSILCAFCKIITDIDNFKNHLVECHLKNDKTVERTTSTPTSRVKKPKYSNFNCERCTKVCVTAAALSSHRKIHDPNRQKKSFKNKTNNSTIQSDGYHQLANIPDNGKTSLSNDTNQINYLNDLYFCGNCPKQFNTRKGLGKHRTVCPKLKNITKKDPPKKYYCTKCKEYFTHSGFAEHWRIIHGIKLTSKRRCPCNKCPFLFMYKIALLMHKEHVHGELHNTLNITNTDAVDCEIKMPELMPNNDAEEFMDTTEKDINVKTEYRENTDTLLDINDPNDQCEESIDGELGNRIEDNVNGQDISNNNDNINIENVSLCEVPIVNQNTFESNDCEMTSKEQLNNKDKLIADNANEMNDKNKDTEFIYSKVIMKDTSQAEESQIGLVQPISINGTQNMNGIIVNDNETTDPLIASEHQRINE